MPGKLYPRTIKSVKKLKKLDISSLHQKGYTAVKIKNLPDNHRNLDLPIHLLSEYEFFNPAFTLGGNPSFFLEKNGAKEYLIINGKVIRL